MQDPQSYEDDAGNVYVREGNRYRVIRAAPAPAAPAPVPAAASPAPAAAPSRGQRYQFEPIVAPSEVRAQTDQAWEAEDRVIERQRQAAADARDEARLRLAEETAGIRGNRYQNKFDEARATRDATRFGGAMEGWTEASALEGGANRARRLLEDGAPVGAFADQRIAAGRVAGDFLGFLPGVPNREQTQQLEQLRLIGSQGALGDVGQLKGPLSEKELAFIQRLQIDPSASRETNLQVADAMGWAARRQAAYGAAMQRWVQDLGSPSEPNAQGQSFDSWWGRYAAENLPAPGTEPARTRRADGVAPYVGPGLTPEEPFDFTTSNRDDVVAALKRGGWFRNGPDGEPYQLPPGVPEYGAEPGDEMVAPGVGVRPQRTPMPLPGPIRGLASMASNIWPQIESFSLAATEQIPFLDEAAAATAAALSGVSYREARDVSADLADRDREQYRGARNAGGVTAGLAVAATPVGAPVRVFKGGQAVAGATRGANTVRRLRNAADAAIGGAAAGAVYGAGQGDGNAMERGEGFVVGGLAGGALGPAAQPAANALGRFVVRPAADAVATVARPVLRAGVEALGDRAPSSLRNALARDPLAGGIDVMARRSQQDPDAMRGVAERMRAETINPTFADAVDDGGRGILRALATRQTPARQAARDFADGRAADIQDRISGQARRLISDDPRAPMEIRDEAQARALEASRPLYEAAFAQSAEPTPLLEDLLRRPATRRALERARTLAANEGRQAEEARLVAMTDFGLPTGGPARAARPDADLTADVAALNAGSRTRGAGQGPSLLEFISRQGGIRNVGGDLLGIDAQRWSRDGAWRNQIVRDQGLDIEDMAQRAYDAGYFPEVPPPSMAGDGNMTVVDGDTMLEAIRRELGGTRRFARDADPEAAMRLERRAALEERMGREGLNPRTASASEAARAFQDADEFEAMAQAMLNGDPVGPPPVEIVDDTRATMQTLDYVKRGLDDVIETYRDPVTGRLNLDDEGRTIEGIRRQYRDELTTMNPAYRAALRAYQFPIREQFGVDTGEAFLNMEADQFASVIAGMSPEQQRVARAAARRAVERAAGTQGNAPGVAARLSTGREQARRTEALLGAPEPLQRAMSEELRALRNAVDVNPRSGSQTSANQQDVGAAGSFLADAVRQGPRAALFDRVISGLTTTRGFSDEEAQAVVMAAIDPAQTDRLIEMMAQRMTTREARNLVRAVRHQIRQGQQTEPNRRE